MISRGQVHQIGELPAIYDSIELAAGRNFLTRMTVLTEERIKHMNNDPAHLHSYEQFGQFIPEVLNFPDYILEGKRGCLHVLKEIAGLRFNLILWIKRKPEPKEYQNSIHTFYEIGQDTWDKWLRNKKVLYKREYL